MKYKIKVVVLAVVLVTTQGFAAVKFPAKGPTELPLQITSPKPGNSPYNLSAYVRGHRPQIGQPNKDYLQKGNDNGKQKPEISKSAENLDVSATHFLPIHASHHNFYPMFFGFSPFFINSQAGFLSPESHLHPSLSGTSLPYLWTVLACPLECEYFATHQQNAFPFFHQGSGPVHDLVEPPFAYATPGRHAPEHRDNGVHVKFPADSSDVDHTKTPPHLLHTRINGQYAPQRL